MQATHDLTRDEIVTMLQAEANIASRPGQLARLTALANAVAALCVNERHDWTMRHDLILGVSSPSTLISTWICRCCGADPRH